MVNYSGTENQRYQPMGIVAYGFNPGTATEEEGEYGALD
jgi:hypothetical protein